MSSAKRCWFQRYPTSGATACFNCLCFRSTTSLSIPFRLMFSLSSWVFPLRLLDDVGVLVISHRTYLRALLHWICSSRSAALQICASSLASWERLSSAWILPGVSCPLGFSCWSSPCVGWYVHTSTYIMIRTKLDISSYVQR